MGEQINRVSSKTLIVLSLIALITVLSGYTQPPATGPKARRHISFSCQSWLWGRWLCFSSQRRIGTGLCEACGHWYFQPQHCFWHLERCITLNTTGNL